VTEPHLDLLNEDEFASSIHVDAWSYKRNVIDKLIQIESIAIVDKKFNFGF
jgi:hypothetical protein